MATTFNLYLIVQALALISSIAGGTKEPGVVTSVKTEVYFVQRSPCISVTWNPPLDNLTEIDYYDISIYTPSVTFGPLRQYLIDNVSGNSINDCLLLVNTKYFISVSAHNSYGPSVATNQSVVTNHLQNVSLFLNDNALSVYCQVAKSDINTSCQVTVSCWSNLNKSGNVLNQTITLLTSNISVSLPFNNGSCSVSAEVVDMSGISVEPFLITKNITVTDHDTESASNGNTTSNNTRTSKLATLTSITLSMVFASFVIVLLCCICCILSYCKKPRKTKQWIDSGTMLSNDFALKAFENSSSNPTALSLKDKHKSVHIELPVLAKHDHIVEDFSNENQAA